MANPPRPSKIVCVGRNYLAHAAELGNKVPDRPLLFFKPPSSIILSGVPIELPSTSTHVEHEAEIGVVIGKRARRIAESQAMGFVAGYVAVNDVTARDLQRTDDQWARAKGYDTFCPVGDVKPVAEAPALEDLEVICRVNGEQRQYGRAADMAFSVPFLIAYISNVMTLEPGDLISTGTPEGVSPLAPGDTVEVEIPGVGSVTNSCVAEEIR